MKITKREKKDGVENFYFDTEEWVAIDKSEGLGEYQEGDDEESYMSGGIVVDGGEVIDYDGCYSLPQAVILALGQIFDVDI